MTLWLYTETVAPLRDGPFYSEKDAMQSPLWEWDGVCVWLESLTRGGWIYENVKWDGHSWVVTSSGLRPAEPFRPEFLAEAMPVPA
jgi:hypothetical protein